MSNRQAGNTVNFIQQIHASSVAHTGGFVHWILSQDADAARLRTLILELAALVAKGLTVEDFRKLK